MSVNLWAVSIERKVAAIDRETDNHYQSRETNRRYTFGKKETRNRLEHIRL